MVKKITRYLKLMAEIARYSYVASLEYRFQYVIRILRIFIEFSIAFIFIDIFFQNTPMLGSWTKNETVLLYGVFTAIYSGVFLLINGNLQDMAEDKIVEGGLDSILVKPIDSQFAISFSIMHVQNLWRIGFGIVMAIYALVKIGSTFTLSQIGIFLVTLASGFIIHYSLIFIVSTLSFWTFTSEPVIMAETSLSIARYPLDIFPKNIGRWLILVPIIFIATVPTKALLGRYDLLTWLSPVVAVITFLAGRKLFHLALRSYSSASS